MDRLVVVGASLTGLRAVEAARRAGHQGSITLIGDETLPPYDRPQLSKAFLDVDAPTQVAPYRTLDELTELGVDLLLGTRAEALDTMGREVRTGDNVVPYDGLLIATGGASRVLPGSERLSGVHHLRTAADATAIRRALEVGARTVVIGAGFIGSEVASAARKRGLDVTVVEAMDLPLTRSVGPDVGAVCAHLHRSHGTDLRLGIAVDGLESADGRVTGVRLGDGSVLPAELVVVGIGVSPSTGWLEGSGVPLHDRDRGVICDATLWTGVPGVYAAGDVAHVASPLFDGDLMRGEHWTGAAEHGALAARHLLDPVAARPISTVPYFWSDWYDHRIQFVGTARADEAVVLEPAVDGFTAVYRRGDRLVGALTINRPRDIMKFRRRIVQRASWSDVLSQAA